MQGASAREVKGAFAVERLLREIGVVVLIVEVDLPVVLLKAILVVVVFDAVRGRVEIVVVEMLPAQGFWVDFLLLKTRLLLNLACLAYLLLYLISFDRRIRFFLAGLLFRLLVALLPKLAEAVLKVILAGLLPLFSAIFARLLGFFPASDCVDSELLVGN